MTKDEIWSVVMLSYLKMAEEASKNYKGGSDLYNKLTMMEKAGLKRTHNYNILLSKYNNSRSNSELAEFIVKTKKTYPDSVILPWTELLNICNKYDLECAPLRDKYYDKLIPNENIEEMMSVRMTEDYSSRYKINNFCHIDNATIVINDYNTSKEEMNSIANVLSRLPFMIINYSLNDTERLNNTLGFYGCKPVYKMDRDKWFNLTPDDWVICAPSTDIKEQTHITIDTRSRYEAEQERIRVLDPLVGKFCKYGFIIFSKWGREATLDEVLKWERSL